MSLRLREGGDTIIEVMMAFSIFSMLAVGALTVMNQGTAGAQDTLETTLVRQQIDNQAEMLRFLHQAYLSDANNDTADSLPGKFRQLVTRATQTQPTPFGADGCTRVLPPASASTRFVLNANGSMIADAEVHPADATTVTPYARLMDNDTSSYGLWIEPVVSNESSNTARYIDFHIRACWNSASSSPQRTLGTIVRLYVPQNVDTGTGGAGGSDIPITPLAHFFKYGSNYTQCSQSSPIEGADNDSGSSRTPFDSNVSNGFPCTKPSSSVYSCTNYDVEYDTGVDTASAGRNYNMTINYSDFVCQGSAEESMPSSYNYRVAVYVNGAYVKDVDLSASKTSETFAIGSLQANSRIQLKWLNNRYIGSSDPDLTINRIDLDEVR